MKTRTGSGRRRLLGGVLAMAVGTSIVVAAANASSPRAAAQEQVGNCSEITLRGDYGLLASGRRTFGGVTEHFVATALWSFHGDGTFTQRTGAAIHGEITGAATNSVNEIAGTYQMNENCTGSMFLFAPDLPFPVEYSFVLVDNGKQISAAVMKPGTATAELVRK